LGDTILGIARASAQTRFLKDFYSFTTILDTGVFQIIKDYETWEWLDVGMLTDLDGNTGILIGVIDADTSMLSLTGNVDMYHNTVLGYRSLSSSEISSILWDSDIVYDYTFLEDKFFVNFNLRDFQLQMYNSGATTDMYLQIFSDYKESLQWESWLTLPQDTLFEYSLTF